jgi:hypothetical protein
MKRATPLGLLARAAACITAGALITVAIAWAAQLWAPAPSSLTIPMQRTGWSRIVPEGWPRAPRGIEFSTTWGVRRWIERGDQWSSRDTLYELLTERAGWPYPALRTQLQRSGTPPSPYDADFAAAGIPRPPPPGPYTGAGIWRKSWRDPSGEGRRRLAVLSDWPGFAIDTAIFAGALGALWLAATALRRRLRRARHRCPTCGYDLKGAPSPTCPECGT